MDGSRDPALSAGHFAQHFDADFLRGYLAQGSDWRLVLHFELGRVALSELARTVGGSKGELKAVGNLFEAVFNGNPCQERS
jgi:hypothetical protein